MTSPNDNPPAFPGVAIASEAYRAQAKMAGIDVPVSTSFNGMTLRDYFAAKALQGLLAGLLSDGSHLEMSSFNEVSKQAFMFADAMLKARQV